MDSVSIYVNAAQCTGCRACEMACSLVHIEYFSRDQARIRVNIRHDICLAKPQVCRQCVDPECVAACPVDALSRDGSHGAVILDPPVCIGCEVCVIACPYDEIFWDPVALLPLKCDLCSGEPACVVVCPHGALTFVDGDIGK